MDAVLLETRTDGVALLTLNRPARLNALDTRLMRELNSAITRLADDKEIGCVVLTGAGRAFCAGGDMKASSEAIAAREKDAAPTQKPHSTFEQRVEWLRRSTAAARLLYTMRKPTICMINGACAGAGFSLAGACDLRIASESALFTTAFINAGISGDYGGSWFWTRILGTGRARELFLLGEKIAARRALELGIVSRLVPDGELHEEVMTIARRFAAGPRATYGYLKENLAAAEVMPLEEALEQESQRMMLSRAALIEARKATRVAGE